MDLRSARKLPIPFALEHDLPVDDSAEAGYGEGETASSHFFVHVYRWQAAIQYSFGSDD